ncbi:LytR/AlgR family response regulator transcription factor [Noviherbaspirillum sedimenti]|uniref:DNA-binding response regulator n=1 Tax=Noviherbaspirillum sedimenti TaxID=2320865 RepID=A0A3A3FYU8_9BURK|nr:LytTR family DNA-binding domain-containing protein [Noviherbaspirillum sedimenti]RJG00525.1 DNA-binding response regulator [Noviherbaspirillum sedimenti]
MVPRLLIVDDEAPARARLAMLLSDIAAECPHQLVGEAAHAQAALDSLAATRPDIVLLDVQMPGMNGIELARHLAAAEAPPAIIFVSAFDEFALKAFEVHALDYLLKPVRAARLAQAIQRAATLVAVPAQKQALAAASASLRQQRRNFSVQERGRLLLVPVTDVLYLKAEAKYVTLRTACRNFLIEESLNSIEEELGELFMRVHRNALVARNAVLGVERAPMGMDADGGEEKSERGERADKVQESWQVIVRGLDERLPVSRRQWPQVKALVRS